MSALLTRPIYLGQMVNGGTELFLGYEDTTTAIMGPRSGKTTCFAIPFVMEAPGNVLCTSNKSDILKATRGYREQLGKIWILDPQGITDERCTWYWNPITYVAAGLRNGRDDRDIRAEALASRWAFSAGIKSSGEGNSSYFTGEAKRLIMRLLLAASVLKRPVTDVVAWVNNTDDSTPVTALRQAGLTTHGNQLRKTMDLPSPQGPGVYDTAAAIVSFLTYQSVIPWVTPGPGREEFSPEAFVDTHHTETLYSLSREGIGSMGALVTSLTVAICEAAERRAEHSPRERLEVPLILVLDEIANVCKWEDLPTLYSHYGSRGIIPIAFLQSLEQGRNVWGDDGMSALVGQSTNVLIGAGTKSSTLSHFVVNMIGEDTFASFSSSHGRGGTSHSVQTQRKNVMDVSDVTAISPGRALLITTGAHPVLLRTIPSYDRYPDNPDFKTRLRHRVSGEPMRILSSNTRLIVDEATPDEQTVYQPTIRPATEFAPSRSKWDD
jgi:type IV secretory pathway TraG/TraD family ATPase VirD4